jgi:hypothetical protein
LMSLRVLASITPDVARDLAIVQGRPVLSKGGNYEERPEVRAA